MEKIKIKVLKNFNATPDNIHSQSYKAGEILEIGTKKMPVGMYSWFTRNPGFGEIYIEEEKALEAPKNKAIEANIIENKSIFSSEEKEEILSEEVESKPKNNSKKRK